MSTTPSVSDPIRLPNFLDEYGATIFRQTVVAMAANLMLDRVSIPIIERYAAAMMTWRNAEQQIAEVGIVIPARRSKVPAINPRMGIARKAAAEARALEKLLGIAPVARRLSIASDPIDADGKPVPKAELQRRGHVVLDLREDFP